jgi:hypothetical protein
LVRAGSTTLARHDGCRGHRHTGLRLGIVFTQDPRL